MTRIAPRAGWIDAVLSEDGPKGSSQRLVALAIANHAKRNGTGAHPSERRLEAVTDLNRRTVRKALARLVESGWLCKVQMGRGKYGKTICEYHLTEPADAGESETDPVHERERHDQWSTDGAANGAPIGAVNGAVIGSPSAPEPITHNPKLITQERTLARPEDPRREEEVWRGKTIADLVLGAEAIAICQKARPGADPLEVIKKFQQKLGSGPAAHWQKALKTFASKERLSDDEQRAAERARYNGVGPRLPGETAEEYRIRSQDPPIDSKVKAAIHGLTRA